MFLQNYSDQPSVLVGNYTVFTHQLLGKGATGSVFRGCHNRTKQPVAVKTIDLAKINDDATKSLLQNQKMALRSVKGPFVLKLQDIIEEKGFCYIVTQFCQGTTLSQYLKKHSVLSQKEAMSIFQKIVTGCQALTQQCIIHRDLKPSNIMVDNNGEPKIIDFGYCQIIMAKKVMKTFNVGSPSYMSPQAYQRTLYSEKSDSWALGMTLYEMVQGQTLDKNMQTNKYFEQLKNRSNLLQKKMSQKLSPEIRQIIKSALKYLPQQRSSINNLKYQADCYQIKANQKNMGVPNSFKSAPIVHSQPAKQKIHQFKSLRTLQTVRYQEESKHNPKGLVIFHNFNKKPSEFKASGMVHSHHKSNLEESSSNSFKGSIQKSNKVGMDQKLERFMQTVVKKPEPTKQNITSQIKFQVKPLVSARGLDHFQRSQGLPPPPKRRQVTVRYI